jgi:phosphoribosylglycinamide formyltransferase-1
LQVSHQHQLTIPLTTPTDALTIGQGDGTIHRLEIISESLQIPSRHGAQAEITKSGIEKVELAQNRWQDGEMGHEAMPAFSDPSDQKPFIQWPQAPLPGLAAARPLRLAVMASGNGSNFQALVEACRRGDLAAEVVLLAVNNADCGAVTRAGDLGISTELHDHRRHPSRESLDAGLIESFSRAAIDLVVMAGWMRIVTPRLIQAFPERLVNIHPSLLPSFKGLDGVGQALAAGVTLAGCTAHLVSEAVDSGQILVQAAVPVLPDDDHHSLSRRIQEQEHRILPLAVRLAAERLAAAAQG